MLQVKIVEWTLEHVVELLYVCIVAIGSLRVVIELHDLTVEITTSVDLSCIVSRLSRRWCKVYLGSDSDQYIEPSQ